MDIIFPSEAEIQEKLRQRRIKKAGGKVETPTPLPSVEDEQDETTTPAEHFLVPKLRSLLKLRLNAYLVGPAGSGKSKAAENAAIELGMEYSAPPIGRETTNAQLFGYFNAAGFYVRTPIRERAEHGGVLHLEEIDFASPAVGTSLNALTANEYIGFPDTAVKRHPDFIIIASANTFGTGATASYIGSQGLNAATLDRFTFLEFPYDEKMEKKIAPNKVWASHVQSVRAKISKLGLRHVVSPRATIKGGAMINSKEFTWDETESMVLFRGLDQLTIDKIRATSNF